MTIMSSYCQHTYVIGIDKEVTSYDDYVDALLKLTTERLVRLQEYDQ
jgi:hypothetical protein